MKKKLYIVQKYVYATSIPDAIKKEKDVKPDDVYLDNAFRKEPESTVGLEKTPPNACYNQSQCTHQWNSWSDV